MVDAQLKPDLPGCEVEIGSSEPSLSLAPDKGAPTCPASNPTLSDLPWAAVSPQAALKGLKAHLSVSGLVTGLPRRLPRLSVPGGCGGMH